MSTIKVGRASFIKEHIQSWDADYFPGSSLGGPQGHFAFIYLVGKKDPIRVEVDHHATFMDWMDKEMSKPNPQYPNANVTIGPIGP